MSIDKNLEILEDGKNNWKSKKQDNLIIANSFLRLARKFDISSFYNINYNMLQCANYLSNLPIWLEDSHIEVREDIVHQSIDGSLSIRKGKYKLELCAGSGGWSYPTLEEITADMPKFQLYDLENDISETTNIIEDNKEIAQEMINILVNYIKNGRSTKGNISKNNGEEIWKTISWFADYK